MVAFTKGNANNFSKFCNSFKSASNGIPISQFSVLASTVFSYSVIFTAKINGDHKGLYLRQDLYMLISRRYNLLMTIKLGVRPFTEIIDQHVLEDHLDCTNVLAEYYIQWICGYPK